MRCLLDSSFVIDFLNEIAARKRGSAHAGPLEYIAISGDPTTDGIKPRKISPELLEYIATRDARPAVVV